MNQSQTLEDYLNGNEANILIYKTLKEKYPRQYDPLSFFHLLYHWFDLFEDNQDNYFFLEAEFDKIELIGEQRILFFHFLVEIIKLRYNVPGTDRWIFSNAALLSYNHINDLLEEIKEELYPSQEELEPSTKSTQASEPIEQPASTKVLDKYSNSQLVLIFYYFFKATGINIRNGIDIAPVAKFMHLITGKEFKATTSSDFYQKLREAPNFKKDKGLINDLQVIKPLFEKVQLNEAVKAINEEIERAKSELNQFKK